MVALRGAGFPADLVLRLAFPESVDCAGRIDRAEQALAGARQEALKAVNAALDALRANGQWSDKEKKRPLHKAIRALTKGKVPAAVEGTLPQSVIDELAAGEKELEAARESFEESYEAAVARQSDELYDIARTPRFREAVLWQNRFAYHTGLMPFLAESPGDVGQSKRRRHQEKLAASYLQRYSVKNDTIGFFGPVGWAEFVDEGAAIDVRPGGDIVSGHEVFLESWCYEAVAKALSRQKAMKPWIIPRLLPAARFDGRSVRVVPQKTVELTPKEAAVLGRLNGQSTAKEIADALVETSAAEVSSENEVYEALEQFRNRGWIEWSFYAPTGPYAHEVLAAQFDLIGEAKLKKLGQVALAALERCRQGVAESAGDVEALDAALEKLDRTFEKLTGESATRGAGQAYTGRTLVYQDCLRDVEAEIGPEIRRAMAPPLSLILDSARWYTSRIARDSRELFREVYLDLVEHSGRPAIDAVQFWHRLKPLFSTADVEYMKKARAAVHERWVDILRPRPEERRLEFSSAALRDRVTEAFASTAPGWQLARHHNPDVLVAAPSLEALKNGEFQIVLGEIHVGLNTLNSWTFMALHPERDEIFRSLDRDLPEPGPRLQPPRSFPGLTTRTQIAHFSDRDYIVPEPEECLVATDQRTLMFSDLVVEETGEGLAMRTRDARHRFPVEEFFSTLISHNAGLNFSLLPPADHWPRITIDRMIVCRESWTLDARELDFCDLKEGSDRFLEAQRLARRHALPRFVFVKAPVEPKPFYLDFASPIYVDVFARVVRRCRETGADYSRIKISEMLPGQDELWLPDGDGRRYSCELRVVVVDRR